MTIDGDELSARMQQACAEAAHHWRRLEETAAIGHEIRATNRRHLAVRRLVASGTLSSVQGPSGPLSGRQGPSGPLSGKQGPSGPLSGKQGPSGPLSGKQGGPPLRPVGSVTEISVNGADLHRQLASLPVIEQAKGILMAQRRCSDREAFALLRQRSQRSNVKLRDLAQAIVEQCTEADQAAGPA